MGLRKNTIKKMMNKFTDCQISDGAIYRMIFKSEQLIEKKTKEAVKLLEDQNKLEEEQGIRKTRRISPELIDEAFSNEE